MRGQSQVGDSRIRTEEIQVQSKSRNPSTSRTPIFGHSGSLSSKNKKGGSSSRRDKISVPGGASNKEYHSRGSSKHGDSEQARIKTYDPSKGSLDTIKGYPIQSNMMVINDAVYDDQL